MLPVAMESVSDPNQGTDLKNNALERGAVNSIHPAIARSSYYFLGLQIIFAQLEILFLLGTLCTPTATRS